MAFTSEEIVKLAGAVLAAGTIDSHDSAWYEKLQPNSFIVDPSSIWSEMNSLKALPANNFAQAVSHAVSNSNIIGRYGINDDGTFNDATAIRLTPVAGTNNKSYVAFNTYNTPADGVQRNWIQPQLVPRANGFPSAAYSPIIFSGPPSNGNMISTAVGNDGNWVSHFWNPAVGMLLISDADAPPSASFPSTDIYLCGFFYNGQTGGAGGSSGNTITLEDEDSRWRITSEDSAHLHFERYDEVSDGVFDWSTKFKIGGSAATDGLVLTQPHGISVDLTTNSLDEDGSPELRELFTVSGENQDFNFGNSEHQTVLETKKGTEVQRADTVLSESTIDNRPLFDEDIVLDHTDSPEAGSFTEISWVSNINYNTDTTHIRFNTLAFDTLETTDDIKGVPVRVSVEDFDGNLQWENISLAGLNAGINGSVNLTTGFNFYDVNPKYKDVRFAKTITRLTIANGHRVKLSGGTYSYFDEVSGTIKNQFVPRQKAEVEYLSYVNILDESNFRDQIWKNSNTVIDNGVGVWYPIENNLQYTQLAAPAEHTKSNEAVLGNYNDKTYLASGKGGLHILFQDDSTRKEFWTEGDIGRLNSGIVPTAVIETDTITLDLESVFESELNTNHWDVVNVENFFPLIRYDGADPISYRVVIESTSMGREQLQENINKYEFLDGKLNTQYKIDPTLNPDSPVYEKLRLPRKSFTVNRHTPRGIVYQFQEPVKVYGYYDNGTFVPSIKAQVVQVVESPIVTGDDLEERVDEIQGEQEWAYATEHNWPTLHEVPSDMWLTDEDGEVLFWSDLEALYGDTDEHQWIFTSGQEAYYEPMFAQGTATATANTFTVNPLVVHIPYDQVKNFDVSFAFGEDWPQGCTGQLTIYIATHGRGLDTRIDINVPHNASIHYKFSTRRDGRYSYRATPYNVNLASTVVTGGDLSGTYPADPSPPVDAG